MAEINTIEEARTEILRLEQENTALVNERDTLSQDNKNLSAEIEKVRGLNQDLFNQVRAQYTAPEDKPQETNEPVLSCVEYAKTIKI